MAKIQPHTSFMLKNNILLSDAGGYAYMVDQEGAFTADSNLVLSTAGKVIGAQHRFPIRISKPNQPVMSWEEWPWKGNDRNTLVEDPGFNDPDDGDFSLSDDSPTLKIGFKPFPLDQAGPR